MIITPNREATSSVDVVIEPGKKGGRREEKREGGRTKKKRGKVKGGIGNNFINTYLLLM